MQEGSSPVGEPARKSPKSLDIGLASAGGQRETTERFQHDVRSIDRREPVAAGRKDAFRQVVVASQSLDVSLDLGQSSGAASLPAGVGDLPASGRERSSQVEFAEAGVHVGKGVGGRHLDAPIIGRAAADEVASRNRLRHRFGPK